METGKEETTRKKLAEMNLLDDFLFGVMVTYPGINERFVRILLRIIFRKDFRRVSVTAQKPLYGKDTDKRGARLDVYLEPEKGSGEHAAVYDVEPDRNDSEKDIAALPRRVRFYHGKIIARELSAGADFDKLKNVVILMIVSYDPFGLGRMMYTIENKCREAPEMPYDDGASTVFLYTGGTVGIPNEEVKQLLGYMVKTTYENAVNDDLKEMHEMVETVKNDADTSLEYWKWQDREIRRQRKAEAIGEARGEARGITIGEARGIAKGIVEDKITLICKKMKLNQSLEKIAEDLVEEISVIEPIYNVAKEFAPDYDPKSVIERINADNRDNMQTP